MRFVEQQRDCSLEELVSASPEELREGISSAEVFRRFFVAKLVRWAAVTKVYENLDSCPGALNYLLTSYALFPDAATAELVARYMILVAVGDVLLDGVLDDESAEAHRCRVSVSALYLRDSAGKSCIPGPPPGVSGAQTLQVIAEQWADMYRQLSPLSEASLLKRWVSALRAHYVSSIREYETAFTENVLVHDLVKGGALAEQAAHAIRLRYAPVAPRPIAERILHLAQHCVNNPASACFVSLELKVLLYLVDVNTIGAGLAFRTAALNTPRQSVSCEDVDALEGTLPVLDARVRLANDLSGFIAAQGRDRDRNKTNSCALLVPVSATGVEREAAIMRAVGAVRRLSCWLDGVLDQAISRLISVWPTMGAAVRRGRQIGVTAYEIGHYTTLSAEEMAEALRKRDSTATSRSSACG